MGGEMQTPPGETVIPNDVDDLGHNPDDDRLALKLAEKMNGTFAFFHSAWHEYVSGCWRKRDIYDIRRRVRVQLRRWREQGVKVNQSRIKSLTSMLEDDLFISDSEMMEKQAKQARYVNMRNGLFNLETSKPEDHDPNLYFTTQLDFDYDPDASAPTFTRYLNSSLVYPDGKTDHSLKQLVLEALAYSLTARTDMKSSFWLVGQKDSGKSTLVALLKSFMGDLHATIDLTQLGVNRFLLAGIAGKRVISFTEASSTTMLPDALYKTLVGGQDEVYADVKNRDPIAFRPECKVWWAMNEMPRISDRSGATTRRIIIIPFNRSIPEHERISDLEQRLTDERAGIFNLLVGYLHATESDGQFVACKQSQDMLAEYILENDTEATFVQECCERHESYKINGSELHNHYKTWCETNGFHAKSLNQVAKDWRRLGFENRKSDGNKFWHGLRLQKP